MRSHAIVLAAALILAPPGARAADLVVWWEKGYYAQEDDAVGEMIAAFEQGSDKQVELAFYPQQELGPQIETALEAGPTAGLRVRHTPHGLRRGMGVRWSAPGPHRHDRGLLESVRSGRAALGTLLNAKTGQKSLYGLPMGQYRQYIHVWKSLLERRGSLSRTFRRSGTRSGRSGAIRCSRRYARAPGRDDIWGVGLSMSANSVDTSNQSDRFIAAYEAEYVTRDGSLIIGDPEVRRRLIQAIDNYTAVYRKGCTPPASVAWDPSGNNQAFHDQAVIMTPNNTLSIVTRSSTNGPMTTTRTPQRSNGPSAQAARHFRTEAVSSLPWDFKDGLHAESTKKFVRFLVGEGWLAHYLDLRASACCRRSRNCLRRRSGSTRATRIEWLQ